MSNVDAVAEKVVELGSATLDTLAPLFPHLTRRQILDALKNGKAVKKVRVGKRGGMARTGRGGSLPSTWVPWFEDAREAAPEPEDTDRPMPHSTAPRGKYAHIGRCPSVWDLAGVQA